MNRLGVIFSVSSLTSLLLGVAACGGGGGGSTPLVPGAVTFWQDVAPIYNTKCVRCHQEGGIAPFRLDDYADAKANAALEKAAGRRRHDAALLHGQRRQLPVIPGRRVADRRAEGHHRGLGRRRHARGDAGDAHAAAAADADGRRRHHHARCSRRWRRGARWRSSTSTAASCSTRRRQPNAFLTGYAVTPGEASIVHHVLAFIVDPQAPGQDGRTNAAIMQSLDDASPDRLGWPCFGAAGDGVDGVGGPRDLGARPGDRGLPDRHGRPDQADRQAGDPDPLQPRGPRLGRQERQHHGPPAVREQRQPPDRVPAPGSVSWTRSATRRPTRSRPGQADVAYTWTRTGRQLGLDGSSVGRSGGA